MIKPLIDLSEERIAPIVEEPPDEERIDLIGVQKSQSPGVTIAIVASIILHTLTLIYIVRNYHPVTAADSKAPMMRYVELIRQNPAQREFVEAPGKKVASAPITAPWSDANRRASMPKPTGETPTTRPGDGSNLFIPPSQRGDGRPQGSAAQQPQQQAQPSEASPLVNPSQTNAAPTPASTTYRPAQAAAIGGKVDWKNAIQEVSKVASLGSGRQGGADIGGAIGGEKGFADSGPISFESQWYDWGEYAESMVSRIRVNWYNNMPELLRTGMQGVVTIRFTIHRDGRISDVTVINTSTIPPYDFAAKKAIELSSPLNPLPKDFPKDSERVTAMFYYNMEVPASHR